MMQKMRRMIITMYIADAIVLALMILEVCYGDRVAETKSVETEKSVFESVIDIDDSETATTDQIQVGND
jgi:hypothetical protein